VKPVTITVAMDRRKTHHRDNEVCLNTEVMAKLREAGVPVVGNISIIGVERGTLSITADRVFGDYIFSWVDDDEDEDPAAGL